MVIIPMLAKGVPDIIWLSLRITAVVGIAVMFAAKYPSVNIALYFFMSVVQDIIALVFMPQISRIYGISQTPLGEFEYIGRVFVWITGIVILQMIVIAVIQYRRKK
ncbi:MAG: hypothetical protein IJ410_03705 [Oscillospiraceae bacterium]|nr:hypothetical protein [Oscillospiraceae bacterium]